VSWEPRIIFRTNLQTCEQLAYIDAISVQAAGVLHDLLIELVLKAKVHTVHKVLEDALSYLIFD